MNVFRRVAGHIYCVYALLLFVGTMLVVLLPIWLTTLLKEPARSRLLHLLFRIWMNVYMPLALCPVFRKGKAHFAKGKNYVVVCNHNSFFDIPVSSPWIPGPNKTLAKREMAKIPLFGIIYQAGSILVNRKDEASRRESIARMQQVLQQGLHLCLYPEGTRNKTDQPLQAFYDGAFITAIQAQKPVMPALIFNTRRILPMKPSFWAMPHLIHFHFLPPVETTGLTMSDVPAFKEKIRSIMEDYYVANRARLS